MTAASTDSGSSASAVVDVAVAAPVGGFYSYRAGPELAARLQAGQLVEVPLGRSRRRGVIMECDVEPPAGVALKPLGRLLDERPVFPAALLATLRWAASYYLVNPGQLVFAALPPALRNREVPGGGARRKMAELLEGGAEAAAQLERAPRQRRLLEVLEQAGGPLAVSELERRQPGARAALAALEGKGLVRTYFASRRRRPAPVELPAPLPVERLSDEQRSALRQVTAALDSGGGQLLLQGVTGSGKTEVYLGAVERTLASGRGAIVMVPEISLTPQLEARVRARFGDQVAVLHSGLADGERSDEWRRLHGGQARVALGARSAVFAPLERVGLIVVDEEHDSSYKQSERLPYNGRDLALVRAREEGAVALLGSATPSLESYRRLAGQAGHHLRLTRRVGQGSLPRVEIVDLKDDLADPVERQHTLGTRLARALAETLDAGGQAILFLNRRGYASFALCKDCGQAVHCTACSVALVHHRSAGRLRCHYCGLEMTPPVNCPSCGAARMRLFGMGTEKCAEEVARRFPGARVLRLDADSVSRRGELGRLLGQFARGQADVLVGTQMVTKGHDIPGVTLVGVVLADLGLNLPDFRAGERTLQQLLQVAGRAGRGERPGRVLIQTFLPQHPVIVRAAAGQLEQFYSEELERRRRLDYPPFRRLLMIRVAHPQRQAAAELARRLAERLRRRAGQRLQVLGPVPSPIARIRNRYRFQVLVKAASPATLLETTRAVRDRVSGDSRAKILFDVDPIDML